MNDNADNSMENHGPAPATQEKSGAGFWRRLFRRKASTGAPDSATPVDDRGTLTTYLLRFLWKRKWTIIILSVIGAFITVAATYLMTPLYKASSKILVKSAETQEVVIFDDLQRPVFKAKNVIPANNIIQLATSEAFARTIVDEFHLDEELRRQREAPDGFREDFWVSVRKLKKSLKRAVKSPYVFYLRKRGLPVPPDSKPNYRQQAIRTFMEDVAEIELVADSDVVKLTIWWVAPGPTEAMAIRLSSLVIQEFVKLEQTAANSTYEFCRDELEKARKDLATAERELHDFKESVGIRHFESQKQALLEQIQDTEMRLNNTTAELAGAKAKLAAWRKELDEQKGKLSSLDAYQNLLQEQIMLTVNVEALAAKKSEHQVAVADVEKRLKDIVGFEPDLRRFERGLALKEKLYVQLAQRHDELAVQRVSDLSSFNIRVIDTPELPENVEAPWPDWMLNLCIGIPLTVMIAVGVALLRHLWEEPFWIEFETGRD